MLFRVVLLCYDYEFTHSQNFRELVQSLVIKTNIITVRDECSYFTFGDYLCMQENFTVYKGFTDYI